MARWESDAIAVGHTYEATFWPNEREGRWPLRATHLDGRRAPKVVLSDDARIVPGVPCLVRVAKVTKPDRTDHGAVLVEWAGPAPFRIRGVYLDPVVSRKLQIALESGLNILLDGPQGSGKTVLARSIASALGMEFVFFNCGAVIEATDFFATIQVRASETGAPVTDFVKTDVLRCIEAASETPGRRYLLFLDELNRCSESARNALMPALDSTRRVFHPIANTFVTIPDNVQVVAAVNRGCEFGGTFGIDAAQLDRFAPIQVTYLPVAEEVKLLVERHPEVPRRVVEKLVASADAVRRSPEVRRGLSVRATVEACIFLQHPLMSERPDDHLPDVLQTSFCGRFPGRWSDVDTEAGAVWGIVQQTLRSHGKDA